MQRSKIEYLRGPDGREGFTWNPLTMRCSRISAGCKNCWHLRFADRHKSNPTFSDKARAAYAGGPAYLDRDELMEPRHRGGHSKIAVQFMGDLFHESVSDDELNAIFFEMLTTPSHTFLILSKRVQRMHDFLNRKPPKGYGNWPFENVWVGGSVEDMISAEKIIPLIRDIPAKVRWISVEPMLQYFPRAIWTGIHWVVCGAETGPHKRPCRQEWIDDLRTGCLNAGVKFFGKVDSSGAAIMPREMP